MGSVILGDWVACLAARSRAVEILIPLAMSEFVSYTSLFHIRNAVEGHSVMSSRLHSNAVHDVLFAV